MDKVQKNNFAQYNAPSSETLELQLCKYMLCTEGTSGQCAYLLLGDVDGPVKDDPDRSLPAARMRGGALVRHVLLRLWQEAM